MRGGGEGLGGLLWLVRLKGVDSLAKQKICDRRVMKVDHHVLLTGGLTMEDLGIEPGTFVLPGTPIQNNLQELWSLLNVVDYERFDSWEDFEKSFSMAMSSSDEEQGKDGDTEDAVRHVHACK